MFILKSEAQVLICAVIDRRKSTSYDAVPLFFAISGFLFFQKLETWSWPVWKQKIRSRVRTLLIPFIIFNAICALSLLCISLKNWLGILCSAPGFSTNALFFFSLGGFAAIQGIDPVEWSRKNIKWILPAFACYWVAASLIVTPGDAQLFENLMFIFGIPVCFWIGADIIKHMRQRSDHSRYATAMLSDEM